jgi:hypothetical protein
VIQAAIVVIVVAMVLVAAAVRAAGPHLPLILACGMGALVVIMAIAVALVKGAARHAVVVWSPPRRVSRDAMLPLPAPRAPLALPAGRVDPFTADGPAWAELIEQAEREELLRQGPREARVIAPRCEGPGCAAELDDNPWKIRAEGGARSEEHSFCSRECATEWQRQDSEAQGERPGRRRQW